MDTILWVVLEMKHCDDFLKCLRVHGQLELLLGLNPNIPDRHQIKEYKPTQRGRR